MFLLNHLLNEIAVDTFLQREQSQLPKLTKPDMLMDSIASFACWFGLNAVYLSPCLSLPRIVIRILLDVRFIPGTRLLMSDTKQITRCP